MYARGLSPSDVSAAISAQNLIIPAGTAKLGDTEYNVRLNSSPDVIAAFDDIPVKTVNGADTPVPFSGALLAAFPPSVEAVVAAAAATLRD